MRSEASSRSSLLLQANGFDLNHSLAAGLAQAPRFACRRVHVGHTDHWQGIGKCGQAVLQENRIVIRYPAMVILFDIDGTLIDHDAAEVIAIAALRGKIEHIEDAAGFLRRWRSAFELHYSRYLAGELSIQQQRRERF